jgi:hypothetical protein
VLSKHTIPVAVKAAAATLAVCVVSGLSTAPALAGEYSVPFCDRSSTGSTASWTNTVTNGSPPPFWYAGGCGYHSGYVYRRFEVWTIPAGASNDWTFEAPAGTYVKQLDMYQDAISRSAGSYSAIYSWQQDGSRSTVAATRPGSSLSNGSYGFPLSGSKVVKLRTSLSCQDTAPCPGTSPDGYYGAEEYWHGAVVHLVDPSSPSFDSVSGEGWKETPVDGRDQIDYSVADAGAGVKEVRFYLDGVLQSTKPAGCVAEALVPCPARSTGSFTIDTTKLSEGPHDVALVVADGSSNETTKSLTITVRRPPQPANPTGSGGPVSISNPGWTGGGAPAVGDQLQGTQGWWIGSGLSFTYQWMRCDADGRNCVAIAGAAGQSYTATGADIGHALQFCVTASNSGGSATDCSQPTAAVVASHPGSGSAGTADRPGEVVKPGGSNGGGTNSVPTPSGGRGHPNGSPAADKVVLTAVNDSRSSSIKTKFGRRVSIPGRLVGVDGAPIAGAIVSVQVQTAMPGASMADAAQVVTGPDGRFRYVAPPGPSRVVRFGYRSYSADTSFADTTDVKLLVAAGVTMKARPKKLHNRHATVFTGRLLGKPLSPRGVVVDLQVFFRNQWRTFAAPRTNSRGVYRFAYRFMAGAATWKFRARVRKETSYPYELGMTENRVKVTVLP